MKQGKGKFTIPKLVSKYPNESDLKREAKRLIAQGKATSKDISMSRKILQNASVSEKRDLIGGKLKPTPLYDKCRGVNRSEMIPKKMKIKLEKMTLRSAYRSIKELQLHHVDSDIHNSFVYYEILDKYEAGFISKVAAFRCITLLSNRIHNNRSYEIDIRSQSHFVIPLVEKNTLDKWEENPDYYYPKLLSGMELGGGSEN